MKYLIKKILAIFKKPVEEIDPRVAPWPFPVGQVSKDFEPRPKKKVIVPKASTRKPAAKKKPAVKKKPLEAHFAPTKKKITKKVTKRLKALEE